MVKVTLFSFVIRSSSMNIISPSYFLILSSFRSLPPSQTNKTTNMMIHNALTVEEIINSFPNAFLPKIDHKPTFEDIQVTTRLLNANAISVPSMSGLIAHGRLGTIKTQVEYSAISATPCAEPYNPDIAPLV
jgi:hypothetical protein